jgi:hypothetical protein
VHELTQEQRVAARFLLAGGAERIVRSGGERLAQESGGGLGAERRRADHRRQRVGDDLVDQARLFADLGRPEAHDDREGEALHSREQVCEPAQGGEVGPVQVVDREQERPAGREVRRQPVEAVKGRQRGIRAGLGDELLGVEERLGQRRRAREQLGSLFARKRCEQRLEELPHDAEREGAFELRASGAEHLHAGAVTAGLGLRHQRGLADAGRAFDSHEQAARFAACDEALKGRELSVALEQLEVSQDALLGFLRALRPLNGLQARLPGRV